MVGNNGETKETMQQTLDLALKLNTDTAQFFPLIPYPGTEAYDWAYENPEKYSLSKAIAGDVVKYRSYTDALNDIKADKDSSGKSISGSRKEKVANYINSLDMDYGEKIILFKSEYEADDTYNEEIIDYLNNRSDITYAEMVEILKQLGFTVTNDGNVYWD
jgi:coproporphyrinogen III oxidase-like Fe-S oxidoreductase